MKIQLISFWILAVTLLPMQMKAQEISSAVNTKEHVTQQISNIWDVFKSRRSIRAFTPDAIPEADIVKIIDAARTAPTAGNQQPWKFLVIRDKSKISQMQEKCVEKISSNYNPTNTKETREEYEKKVRTGIAGYFSAPVFIIILTDNNSMYPDYNHWDGPMAAGYLMLAARALGYGTVFITDSIPESVTKEVFNIPDTYTRVCITPLGVPVEWPKSPEKKKLEDFILFDKF